MKPGMASRPPQVDQARLGADEGRDLLARTDGDDGVAARGQRLGLRPLLVDGGDLALVEDERRGLDLRLALAGDEQEGQAAKSEHPRASVR